jgi:PncC family amidohydrolase
MYLVPFLTMHEPSLLSAIATTCTRKGLSVATAESATGGLIAHTLTNTPGSSAFFLGGVVAYHNSAKTALLGVRHTTLKRFGAVSQQTAAEMAEGARKVFQADIGLSTTGIAGPNGGSPAKPVGLVYIGCASTHGTDSKKHVFSGDRLENKRSFCLAALHLLAEAVTDADH